LLVISFDGVSDREFQAMAADPAAYPNIARFMDSAHYRGDVKSVFVSNTYPVHASIATGKLPREHGVTSNLVHAGRKWRWARMASDFKCETLWDKLHHAGRTTAAILWPTTGGAKTIRWNMPEVPPWPGGGIPIIEGVRQGSTAFQIKSILRHCGKLFRKLPQPGIDNFALAVTCDLLRAHRPDLTLLHLLAYDLIRHKVGGENEALNTGRASLDSSLGRLLEVADDMPVLIFSDHAHLDVEETLDLSKLLGDDLFEQCCGSAFLKRPVEGIEQKPWFGRFLTPQELEDSGYAPHAPCGIAAKPGYRFSFISNKSDHGYPTDYENYRVFYALRSKNPPPPPIHGDVRDITAIIARELGLDLETSVTP